MAPTRQRQSRTTRLDGRTLLVRPYVYRIGADQAAREALVAAGANGAHLGDEGRVLINPSLGSEAQVDTLVHESLHAVWRQSGLLSVEYPDTGQDSVGERLIQELTPRIISLMRDNPWLVRFILAGAR